jgi:hypothetical protein
MPEIIRLKTKDLKTSFRQSQESPPLIETLAGNSPTHSRSVFRKGELFSITYKTPRRKGGAISRVCRATPMQRGKLVRPSPPPERPTAEVPGNRGSAPACNSNQDENSLELPRQLKLIMKKTHYKHGCSLGRWSEIHANDTGPVVKTIEEVTCKNCISVIRKRGLKNRSEFPEIPTFEVIASGRFKYPRGKTGCHLSFTCPACGSKNSHGGEYEKIGEGDGHRVSHCGCWKKGYFIKEVSTFLPKHLTTLRPREKLSPT